MNFRRTLGLALLFFCLPLRPAGAGTTIPCRTLHVGDSVVWGYRGMTTAATGDPAVADLLPLSTHGLLVIAKAAGRTTIVVFDQRGRHVVQVVVAADASRWPAVAALIQSEIGLPTVTARALKDVIFLEGTVTTPLAAQRAQDIAQVYAPTVRDLVQVAPDADAPSLAATYAALINETWAGRGIAARVMDPQTIALTGTYTPPLPPPGAEDSNGPEPDMTDALTGGDGASTDIGRAAPARHHTTRTPTARERAGAAAPDPLAGLLSSLPAALNVVNLVQIGDRPVQQILVSAKVIDIDRNSLSQIGVGVTGAEYLKVGESVLASVPADPVRAVAGRPAVQPVRCRRATAAALPAGRLPVRADHGEQGARPFAALAARA